MTAPGTPPPGGGGSEGLREAMIASAAYALALACAYDVERGPGVPNSLPNWRRFGMGSPEKAAENWALRRSERTTAAVVVDALLAGPLARLTAERDGLRAALVEAEACLSIVPPRSDTAEYLRTLGVVRAALLHQTEAPDER